MYNVSETFKNKILEDDRLLDIKVDIEHEQGEIELEIEDISLGGFTYNSKTQSGDDFTIGGTVASDISISFFNNEEFSDIDFTGAIISPKIGLLLNDSNEDSESIFNPPTT